jgi:chromosome segregation ATPase
MEMEFEQIIKRLDWLDEEHRKDKLALDALSEKLEKTESELKIAVKQIKELGGELSQVTTASARIDRFDGVIAQQRTDIVKYIDGVEKKRLDNLGEIDKRYQLQFEGLQKAITELRKFKEPIAELKQELKSQADENTRRDKAFTSWEPKLENAVKAAQEIQRAQKAADEAHRQDTKRIADLQGEVSATRKRMDEVREKSDLFSDDLRRLETRLNEVLASEAERKQTQTGFLETQARAQIERDRAWKEMEERLASVRKQTETMDHYLLEWDANQRAVKRAQEAYEEIVQKFERRINEITEMQRLAEDRFRQEWVTFKSDDQKRWTSYSLSQDETHKDVRTYVEKLEGRLTSLEDLAQTQQDVLQQTKDANEQLFQGMLAQIHELLAAYERIMSTK